MAVILFSPHFLIPFSCHLWNREKMNKSRGEMEAKEELCAKKWRGEVETWRIYGFWKGEKKREKERFSRFQSNSISEMRRGRGWRSSTIYRNHGDEKYIDGRDYIGKKMSSKDWLFLFSKDPFLSKWRRFKAISTRSLSTHNAILQI